MAKKRKAAALEGSSGIESQTVQQSVTKVLLKDFPAAPDTPNVSATRGGVIAGRRSLPNSLKKAPKAKVVQPLAKPLPAFKVRCSIQALGL